MMRKNPDDRFSDCKEVMEILTQYQEAPGSFELELPPPTPVEPKPDKKAKAKAKEIVSTPKGQYEIETAHSVKLANPIVRPPNIRKKRRKSAPKWLVPALIVGMISALIGVLFLMSRMVS
jgi:hypothetical protein